MKHVVHSTTHPRYITEIAEKMQKVFTRQIFFQRNLYSSFHSVVVITSALHAEGRRFEPGWKQYFIIHYYNLFF